MRDEQEIFEIALEIKDAVKRNACLVDACSGDDHLLKEVQSLVAAAEDTSSFLVKRAADSFDIPTDFDAPDVVGQTIGRYKLLEQIGEGGFGNVFMAEQVEPVVRKVALKVIKPGMDSKQVIARFEAERQALAMMDHPNIGKILDAGATESGRPYFVMELVRGIPITDYCGQRKLSTRQRLELFTEVCSAIEHAHQKGIIHRDIKPTNVLVYNNGERAVAKVIDFGIAKATQGRLTDKTLFTQFHQFIGTPSYMSPEQAQMSGVDVDTRSDIYSLGVLLYELLTGKTPLDLKNFNVHAYQEACRRIREDDAPKPSKRISTLTHDELSTLAESQRMTTADMASRLRGDLDWIVMKALEKDRSRRYKTTDALVTDIGRHLRNEPVSAGPPGGIYYARKFLRRHRAAAMVAIGVTILLAGATAVSSLGWSSSYHAWKLADELRESADNARAQAEEEKVVANEQRRLADEQRRIALNTAYLADMAYANDALRRNELGLARLLLARYHDFDPEFDVRHFEFGWLSMKCKGDALKRIEHPDGNVTGLSIHPEGRFLATSGYRIRVFDLETEKVIWQPPEDQGWNARFSPDGASLYIADATGDIRGYHVPGFEPTGFHVNHGGPIDCYGDLEISPQGTWLAVTGEQRDLTIWDAETATQVQRIDMGMISPVEFVGEDRLLFFNWTGVQRVDFSDWSVTPILSENGARLAGKILFSPSGDTFARRNGTALWVHRVSDGESRQLGEHGDTISDMVFSPDGRILATSSLDQTVRLWDVVDFRPIATLRDHETAVTSIEFPPDGQRLISGSHGGRICLWDAKFSRDSDHIERNYNPASKFFPTFSASCDGKLIACTESRGVAIMSARDLSDVEVIGETAEANMGTVFSPCKHQLAIGQTDGLKLFTLNEDGPATEVQLGPGTPLRFSSDGKRLLALDVQSGNSNLTKGTAIVYDVDGRRKIGSWPINDARGVTFSPDGKWIVATTVSPGGLSAWPVDDASALPVFWGTKTSGATGDYRCIVFSPDGRYLAAGSVVQGAIDVFDFASRKRVTQLRGHELGVGVVRFSTDSRRLASVGGSGTGQQALKVWDVDSGRELLSIPQANDGRCVEWLPGGSGILFGGSDGTMKLYRGQQ